MDSVTSIPTNLKSLNPGPDRFAALQVGGEVIAMTAAAALRIGDAVYADSNGKAAKSATAGTVGPAFIGFVVGGWSFDKEGRCAIPGDANTIKASAAATDELVWVQISGIANAISDAAQTIGARVIGGATAGQIAAGTTAGSMLGTALSAGGTDALIKVLIDHR